jgi:hypothetical protein
VGLILALAGLLGGCEKLPPEADDFGARMVADRMATAKSTCSASAVNDVWECAAQNDNKPARKAALNALGALDAFQQSCFENIGMTKCDRLLTEAMARPTAQK